MAIRNLCVTAMAVGAILAVRPVAVPQAATTTSTVRQFLNAASPIEVTAARKTDRIAWIAYEEGKRNVYTAAAPAFAPVRLTAFLKDDGIDLTGVRLSADGSTVVFVRGSAANRDGWNANPGNHPGGAEQAVWAARTATPGVAWRVVQGNGGEVSPDGRYLLFARDGQIHRARLTPTRPASEIDRGEKPFIRAWGVNSNPSWSPDGSRIAFVSNRTDHSYIGIYHSATHTLTYIDPGVDRDSSPIWEADGRHLIFTRRPGAPFGQQSQPGSGGLGLPAGPAFQPPAAAPNAGRGQGRGGGGGRGQQPAPGAAVTGQAGQTPPAMARGGAASQVPGLMSTTLPGGHTMALMRADVTTGVAREFWRPDPADRMSANLPALRWAGDHLIFQAGGGGRGGRGGGRGGEGQAGVPGGRGDQPAPPQDEWERYYSLNVRVQNAKPVLLTTTDGIIEDQTSIAISPDGKFFYYSTNAGDIDRRHVWAVPTGGGAPRQVTTGTGIETYPAPLASGRYLATLSATWKMPQSLGVWPTRSATPAAAVPGAVRTAAGAGSGAQKIIFPLSRPGFLMNAHVEPQNVITTPEDGMFKIHNQLFLPKDIRPGDKRPAMIFVHGGPVRQMLLGYHYRYVYHQYYAVNQWLASQGYVVLSVNFRGGVGYGRSFQGAPNRGQNGNSEYQDVVAGAKYLQSRPDVDPKRIGIYGLSYGGLLTAQALARNSDLFAAGVDYAGVHLYGSSLDPEALSYRSSAISQIDNWKSPVLLIHGDDDRNVNFAQTVGLVQLLRQRNIYHELIVFPDDVHDSLLHSRWVYMQERMETFLRKFLGEDATPARGR
jgi:dipeptidyl-peptidase-4